MSENLQPESMQSWMRSVEKRLAAVERPARLSTVQYGSILQPNTSVNVTSGTYTSVWEFNLGLVVADAVSVRAILSNEPGTTSQARLFAPNTAGTPTTSDASVPAGASRVVVFDWLVPGVTLGNFGVLMQLQVRRSGGSGNVVVFNPFVALQAPSYSINATADGNPRVL